MTRRSEGFALVEAVLTVGILAAGVTALFASFHSSLRSARAGGEVLRAAALLEARAWELEALREKAPEAAAQDPALGPLRWSFRREDRASGTLTLAWGDAGRDLSLPVVAPE